MEPSLMFLLYAIVFSYFLCYSLTLIITSPHTTPPIVTSLTPLLSTNSFYVPLLFTYEYPTTFLPHMIHLSNPSSSHLFLSLVFTLSTLWGIPHPDMNPHHLSSMGDPTSCIPNMYHHHPSNLRDLLI